MSQMSRGWRAGGVEGPVCLALAGGESSAKCAHRLDFDRRGGGKNKTVFVWGESLVARGRSREDGRDGRGRERKRSAES